MYNKYSLKCTLNDVSHRHLLTSLQHSNLNVRLSVIITLLLGQYFYFVSIWNYSVCWTELFIYGRDDPGKSIWTGCGADRQEVNTQRFSLQAPENFIELHSQNKCNQFHKLNELCGDTVATIQHGIGVIVSFHKLAVCKSSFTALWERES